jgi:peptidyl-Asp metalloendopeptidase
VTTTGLRILVTAALDTWSRITEVEAYEAAGNTPPRVNVAAASAGASASASSVHSAGYAAAGAINGDRRGSNWANGGGWNDGTENTYPDWLQVNFAGAKTIGQVALFTVQDGYGSPTEPTSTQTFSLYGVTDFTVQYWTGSTWATVPGGAIAGNRQVWRTVTFAPLTTTSIRILVTGALNSWSRVAEVEVY